MQKENDCVDRALDSRDGALPVHCNLESHPNCVVPKVDESGRNVVEMEEVVQAVEVVDEDAQGGERDEISGEDIVLEECEEVIVVDGLDIVDDEKGADLPLPDMAGGESQLIEEQRNDDSLIESSGNGLRRVKRGTWLLMAY